MSAVPATVTPIRPPRAATRLGPREARVLAQRARAAGCAPGAARGLLELLLRVCDPRHDYARQLPRRTTRSGRTEGLLDQLGVSRSTLIRAVAALEAAGLLTVTRGDGTQWTTYRLEPARIAEVCGQLPDSPWGSQAVNPGESDTPGGFQNDTPPVSERHPRGAEMTPPTRARASQTQTDPIPPHPRQAAGGELEGSSPPASGQGPLSSQRCEHGRTAAQGGCRACGTTRRDQDRRTALEQRTERKRAEVAEQLRQRAELEAARAAAPPPDPDVIKALRDAARAGKRAPK